MKSVTNITKTIVKDTISNLQKDLFAHSNPENSVIMQNYMKNVSKYRGIKSSDLRTLIFKDFWSSKVKQMDLEDKKEIAHYLLSQEYGEDRFIGSLIFEKLKKDINFEDIKRIEALFNEGKLIGWANTDGICGTVFKHWSAGNKENTRYISEWRNSDCIWLQRASCVSFVTLAKHGDKNPNFDGFLNILNEICLKTVQNQERFVQLGTGWLLRNIGEANQKQLLDFIEENLQYFSREGLSYAIEKLEPNERKRIMSLKTRKTVLKLKEEYEEKI